MKQHERDAVASGQEEAAAARPTPEAPGDANGLPVCAAEQTAGTSDPGPRLSRVDFDKRAVRRWRRDIYRALSRDFSPAETQAGMVLAAIIAVGTDPEACSELTGLSVDYVTKVTKRLRKQRIVQGGTLSAAWAAKGDDLLHEVGAVLDCGVAAGVFVRGVDPKRSAAQKARKPETRARGPRGPRKKREPWTIDPPKIRASNPLFGLPEWEKRKSDPARLTPLEPGKA